MIFNIFVCIVAKFNRYFSEVLFFVRFIKDFFGEQIDMFRGNGIRDLEY